MMARTAAVKDTRVMGLILLEALAALLLLVVIVWWTMFSGRPPQEGDHSRRLPHSPTDDAANSDEDSTGPR